MVSESDAEGEGHSYFETEVAEDRSYDDLEAGNRACSAAEVAEDDCENDPQDQSRSAIGYDHGTAADADADAVTFATATVADPSLTDQIGDFDNLLNCRTIVPQYL